MRLLKTPAWIALISCISAAALTGGPSIQSPSPREELIRELADPQIDVRISAAEILYKFETVGPTLFVPLINAVRVDQGLGDERLEELIEYLACALSEIGKPALPMLGRTLRHHDPRVRLLSVRALFELGSEDKALVPFPVWIESIGVMLALQGFDEHGIFETAHYFGHQLAKIDSLPLAPFIRILENDPDWRFRLIAVYFVSEKWIPDEAVLPLIQALGDRFRIDPPMTDRDFDEPVAYPVRELALGLLKEESYRLQRRGSISQAQELLLDNLESEDQDLRRRSIDLLGEFNVSAAVEPLVRALQDTDPQIRSSAAEALRRLEDPGTFQPFIPLLSDPDPEQRLLAAEALLKLEDEAVNGPLIALLQDEDVRVRRKALPVLERLDSTLALRLLVPLLEDSNAAVRSDAVQQLGSLHQEEGVLERLLAAADDPHRSVRYSAINALGKGGWPKALDRVIKALSDPDPWVRSGSVRVLGNWPGWKEARVLDGVIQALTDSDPTVREAAFEVVEWFRLRRAAGQLVECFKVSDAELRSKISKLLVKIGGALQWRALAEMVITRHQAADEAIWILGRVRYRQALPDLREALEDKRPRVRSASAEALGTMRDPRSAGLLAALLKDPDISVRSSAAKALGHFRSPDLSDALLEALADPNRRVLWAAAESLGKHKDQRAIARIASLIRELEKPLEKTHAVALLRFFPQPESVRVLIEALGDGDHGFLHQACKTLVKMARPQLIEALAPLLQDPEAGDDPVASRALKTLSAYGHRKEIEKWREWWKEARGKR